MKEINILTNKATPQRKAPHSIGAGRWTNGQTDGPQDYSDKALNSIIWAPACTQGPMSLRADKLKILPHNGLPP